MSQLIGKGITTPLYEMKRACERLRDGDFRESERRIVRGDEFGDMAATVAEMRTSINKLMRSTNDSAQQIAARAGGTVRAARSWRCDAAGRRSAGVVGSRRGRQHGR